MSFLLELLDDVARTACACMTLGLSELDRPNDLKAQKGEEDE